MSIEPSRRITTNNTNNYPITSSVAHITSLSYFKTKLLITSRLEEIQRSKHYCTSIIFLKFHNSELLFKIADDQ